MTVYEILVSRGKRKRMMAAKEDPFERVERQLRAAKRFRVEEYIRSLAMPVPSASAAANDGSTPRDLDDPKVDEDEQRRRYAFFFGGDRTVAGGHSSTTSASSSLPSLSPIAPSPPRTTVHSTTVHPTRHNAITTASVVRQQVFAPTSATATATAVPVTSFSTFTSPNHPAMRLHRMCESGGSPGAAAAMAATATAARALRSLYPPSRPNILASPSTLVTSPASSPAAALSSPVSSPAVVHSPRPATGARDSPAGAATAACSCSHPPSPAASAGALRVPSSALRSSPPPRTASPGPPAPASTSSSSSCGKARLAISPNAPQATSIPASGMCD